MKKAKEIDNSRPVKYHVGEIVKWEPRKGFAIVDHNSGEDSCWIQYYNEKPIAVSENSSDLRKISLLEFFCYVNPVRNTLQMGKNGFFPSLFAIIMSFVFMFSYTYVEQPFWMWLIFGIGFLIFSSMFIGTVRNYFNKQF